MVLAILKPRTTVHKLAARAESVSGIATPGTYLSKNSAIHTIAANRAIERVSRPILALDARKKDAVTKSIDIGKSTKKATEA